jgi:hypothetical protein
MALAMVGISFTLTLYLQFVQGYTALEAGVRLVPYAAGVFLGAASSHRLVAVLKTKPVILIGFMGTAAMGILASFWQIETAYWQIAVILGGIGFFLGYIAAPATTTIMNSLPEDKAGIGSATNSVARMVSGSIGVAILGSALSTIYASSFEKAVSTLPGLPKEVVKIASDSVGAAVTVAGKLPPEMANSLLLAARNSFMDGWQAMTYVTCGISILGIILILIFMPSFRATEKK